MPVVQFDWDEIEDNVDEEFDENLSSTVEYSTEPELYGNVLSQYRDAVTSTLHADGLGSTIALTNDAGDVSDTIQYSAFGETSKRTGTTVIPYQFVGQKGYFQDAETSDYYVRRRAYRPGFARWLSTDPLGFGGGDVNLFRYANGRVLTCTDPNGTSLFAVDGTWNTWTSNTNVSKFLNRVTESSEYRKYYQAGTQSGFDGADAGDILKKLVNGICYEYCFGRQECTKIDIDLLGYSRGAVIVATAAKELDVVGCECEKGKSFKNIAIRWIGLFDAVNWIGRRSWTPMSGSWATAFSSNIVNTPAHAIHTSADNLREVVVFKTEMGFQPTTPFSTIIWRRGGRYETRPSTHPEIGRSDGVLAFMIAEARRAGVPVQ